MPVRTVWMDSGKMLIRGQKINKVRGRSAFKLPNLISMHYAGMGDDYKAQGGKYGALDTAFRFIDHNQRLFGTQTVWLRVLGESAGWTPILAGTGMFGSPAQDAGIVDVNGYRRLCLTGDRVRELTALNLRVLDQLFSMSHVTGCVFEYVCDATLKHTEGMCQGVIDHHLRQTAVECRRLQALYPNAAVMFSARNEWDAHNDTGTTLAQVNQWARRFYRWRGPLSSVPTQSFDSPGEGWEAEQWPEGMIIVDHGGRDLFDYDCGPEPGKFKLGALHPLRKNAPWHKRSTWWSVTPEWMADVRRDSRGQPVAFTESMYFVSKPGTEGWYRNVDGWNDNLNDQMVWVAGCDLTHGPDVFVVHDDIGVQSDADWNRGTQWESRLAEFYGGKVNGGSQPPPPPPPPTTNKLRIARDDEKEFVVERDPETVKGGSEEFVLKETFTHKFTEPMDLSRLHVFHGLDRGDIVEMDTEIHADGQTMYTRSMHKETPGNYDAWDTAEFDGWLIQDIEITVICRVNGKNETLDQQAINEHRGGNRLTARPHFGIRLVWD